MTEFVRFTAAYEYRDKKTGRRTRYPVGWAGEVDGAVATGAREARAVAIAPKTAASSAALTEARKAVRDAEAAFKAAKTPDDKTRAENELQAAQRALAALEA